MGQNKKHVQDLEPDRRHDNEVYRHHSPARWISGTFVEFDCSPLRTVRRDSFSTRAISLLPTPCALNSRIAPRCAWLSVFRFLLLPDSPRQPVESRRALAMACCACSPLPAVHLQQRVREPPVGTAQDGGGHLRIALYFLRGRLDGRRLPLRFQKRMGLCARAPSASSRATLQYNSAACRVLQ